MAQGVISVCSGDYVFPPRDNAEVYADYNAIGHGVLIDICPHLLL